MGIDKRPGALPVGIGETLHQALAKLIMWAAGDQAKTEFGNLKLCVALEDGIEVTTHNVGERQLYRVRERRIEE